MSRLRSIVPLCRTAELESLLHPDNSVAIGAFNVNFFAQAVGILEGLLRAQAPGIIQASRGANEFQGGPDKIKDMILKAMKKLGMEDYPIALHLDHGTTQTAFDCIGDGFSSVMIDRSELDFERNIATTKEIVEIAHKAGVSVEGEYGGLGGEEEDVKQMAVYSNPLLVPYFFEESGVDALAVTYGTAHGQNKLPEDADVNKILRIPVVGDSYRALKAYGMNERCFMVGHGSSTVPQEIVAEINQCDGKLGGAKGIPVEKIIEARNAGIRKFNIDTDLRLGITAVFRKYLCRDKPEIIKESVWLRTIKRVFDDKLPVFKKNPDTDEDEKVDPGLLTDPRDYLGPVDKDVLRNDYEGTDMEELMTRVKDRVAAHVQMLVTDVFNCAGLATKVPQE